MEGNMQGLPGQYGRQHMVGLPGQYGREHCRLSRSVWKGTWYIGLPGQYRREHARLAWSVWKTTHGRLARLVWKKHAGKYAVNVLGSPWTCRVLYLLHLQFHHGRKRRGRQEGGEGKLYGPCTIAHSRR